MGSVWDSDHVILGPDCVFYWFNRVGFVILSSCRSFALRQTSVKTRCKYQNLAVRGLCEFHDHVRIFAHLLKLGGHRDRCVESFICFLSVSCFSCSPTFFWLIMNTFLLPRSDFDAFIAYGYPCSEGTITRTWQNSPVQFSCFFVIFSIFYSYTCWYSLWIVFSNDFDRYLSGENDTARHLQDCHSDILINEIMAECEIYIFCSDWSQNNLY